MKDFERRNDANENMRNNVKWFFKNNERKDCEAKTRGS